MNLSGTLFLFAGAQFTARLNRSAPLDNAAGRVPPPAPRDDFERAIREAQRWHIESWRVVNDQRYAVEAWDSAAADELNQAAWHAQLTALDLFGCLRRARLIARQAAALAHTPEEQYRAALLQAVLACEAGDHRAEWQQVRVLARYKSGALQPGTNQRDEVQLRIYGNAAIITARETVTGSYQGQEFHNQLPSTQVFVKRNGHWLLAHAQLSPIVAAPPAAPR